MEARVTHPGGRSVWLSGCVSLILLMVVGMGSAWAEAIGGFVVPGSRAAELDRCVEPTRAMRRYHMEYIRHQRDTTVYDGIRHTKYSLSGCVDCHASHDGRGTPVPVSHKGQFCNSCHETAAVTLNCFDCHATVPDGESWNQVSDADGSGRSTVTRHSSLGDDVTGGAALAQAPEAARQQESESR